MKVYLLSLMMALISITEVKAISYEEARNQARFLTDKMAYELNLNDAQYNHAYEINLDYLISIQRENDASIYLSYRNRDLCYVLYDWQYTLFVAADYFFRPVRWMSNRWYYPIYTHYHIGHFYYDCPRVYSNYRGGHGGRYHRHVSYYEGRRPSWQNGFRGEHRGPITNRRPDRPEMGNNNYRPGNNSNRPSGRPDNGFHFEPVTPNRGQNGRPTEGRREDEVRDNRNNDNPRTRPEKNKRPEYPDIRERRTPVTTPSRNNDRPSRPERRENAPSRMDRRTPAKENGNIYQRKSSTRSTVRNKNPQSASWTSTSSYAYLK